MGIFLTLLLGGVVLSIVGAAVEAALLTVIGMLMFLGAVVYAVRSARPTQRTGSTKSPESVPPAKSRTESTTSR
jgi:hypothetical protein